MWPSMVTHTRNLSSAFNPSKCTLTAVNTHPEQWAAILRRPGSSWGIGALLKGLTSVVVLKVEVTSLDSSPLNKWEWFKFKVKEAAIKMGKYSSKQMRVKQKEIVTSINILCSKAVLSSEEKAQLENLKIN